MTTSLIIRPPRAEDALDVAELLTELGYRTDAAEMTRRLGVLVASPRVLALIAERDRAAAGVITAHAIDSIHDSAPVVWVTTLVVRRVQHGQGIGSRLLEAAERWATDQGAVRLSVSSGLHRAEAHGFYERRGFARTGLRFTKVLAAIT